MTETNDRCTLDCYKVYLDSCATYHTFFVEEYLYRVEKDKTTTNGSCNAGMISTDSQGWYGDFKVWPNKKGIANLLSISMLEKA